MWLYWANTTHLTYIYCWGTVMRANCRFLVSFCQKPAIALQIFIDLIWFDCRRACCIFTIPAPTAVWHFTVCATNPISSGFSRFCLKIPNPDAYAVGIGKIPTLTCASRKNKPRKIFSSNSYCACYTRWRNTLLWFPGPGCSKGD